MKALLIVAHGSRRNESNDEVHRLAERIRKNSGPTFDRVSSAFLEIAGPQMDSAVADLVSAGMTDIKIFPYFLAAGTHVATDIPRLLDEERNRYPQVNFEILPHLGALPGISNLILKQVYKTSVGEPVATD